MSSVKVYMPPEPRTEKGERRVMHQTVRQHIRSYGAELMQRPTGNTTMNWMQRAGGVVLETNAMSRRDEAECIYAAQSLGKSVLILFDARPGSPHVLPSDDITQAADKVRDPDTRLWLVRYTSGINHTLAPSARSALDIFGALYLGCKTNASHDPLQQVDEEADFQEAFAAEERARHTRSTVRQ